MKVRQKQLPRVPERINKTRARLLQAIPDVAADPANGRSQANPAKIEAGQERQNNGQSSAFSRRGFADLRMLERAMGIHTTLQRRSKG